MTEDDEEILDFRTFCSLVVGVYLVPISGQGKARYGKHAGVC